MTRAVAYFAVRDLIPFYAVYALLFRDSGLSDAAISWLFVVWSITSFVFEVPSGAWADMVSRRNLLVLSSLLYAAGFTLWIVAPTYAGFAAGFVLWGVSGALMSGTFEALVYDELAARGAATGYPRLMGWANTAAVGATLVATASAAPLLRIGGYRLVGWASVAAALAQAGLALSLPRDARTPAGAAEAAGAGGATGRALARYLATLATGLDEAARSRPVRLAVVLAALLLGVLAFDEYFPVVAADSGTWAVGVPLLMVVLYAGEGIGVALAGRTARLPSPALGWALACAGAAVAAGAASGSRWGLALVAVGYGIASNAAVVGEARVQQAIRGPARATVASVTGFSSELVAVAVFAGFAVGSAWLRVGTMVALLGIPLLGLGWMVRRWLPGPEPGRPG